jgi:2-dehydro-3-deoxy-D-arabinonate dehydratase
LEARTAESAQRTVYDLVYEAERPELFFKALPRRVAGPGGTVGIRADSSWNVPEPELALAVNSGGEIVGYTLGNDMSSRSIEGANPLYLPQAKTYESSCAIGPVILPAWELPDPRELTIELAISRAGRTMFSGEISVGAMRRKLEELVEYLFRALRFPHGVFLLTGTGIVPPDDFTLEAGDEVRISADPIGELVNTVVTV